MKKFVPEESVMQLHYNRSVDLLVSASPADRLNGYKERKTALLLRKSYTFREFDREMLNIKVMAADFGIAAESDLLKGNRLGFLENDIARLERTLCLSKKEISAEDRMENLTKRLAEIIPMEAEAFSRVKSKPDWEKTKKRFESYQKLLSSISKKTKKVKR
ncbi:MAG: hypothetical protein V1847_05140, partial [Candidatus Diapherotrites archaeon]